MQRECAGKVGGGWDNTHSMSKAHEGNARAHSLGAAEAAAVVWWWGEADGGWSGRGGCKGEGAPRGAVPDTHPSAAANQLHRPQRRRGHAVAVSVEQHIGAHAAQGVPLLDARLLQRRH
jgi:hypothetical protein